MAYSRFIIFTCFLAFVVIVLGAYTRLGDAGLGCPDWPGCYGQLTVPESPDQVVEKTYLDQRALEPEKGWKEMIHRYFAGTLGLAILVIAIWSWWRRLGSVGGPVPTTRRWRVSIFPPVRAAGSRKWISMRPS